MQTVFIPREAREGETRVAATPETVRKLLGLKLRAAVQKGSGERAGFPDASYAQAGAELVGSEALDAADLVLGVQPPGDAEAARLKTGAILVAFLHPHRELALVGTLRERGVTALAMELIPRISRAQFMDALSSQSTVAGYKAVLLGATHLRKLCPQLTTAAGTVQAARAVVFGAGVAGLQAIATARRLGCVVEATDVRLAAKEQVESLGAKFITVPGAADMEGAGGYAKEQSEEFLRRQREEIARRVAEADLVITTAQVPGKRAPVLVTRDMVRSMRPGSVVVDMALDSGGNCELSEKDRVVVREGVTLVGITNLAATVPQHASELYAKNVLALVKLLVDKEGRLAPDFRDEVLAGCRLTHEGVVHHAPTAQALAAQVETGRVG